MTRANTPGLGEVGRAEIGHPEELTWRELGACRGLDPNIFFPDDNDDASEAKAICGSCVVRIACLEYALTAREKVGLWGGATERERRRIIRQRRQGS